MDKIDIGDLCTHCGRDTSFGSGNLLFVNRIPSDSFGTLIFGGSDDIKLGVGLLGYMCPECQAVECDNCGDSTLDPFHVADITDFDILCETCIDQSDDCVLCSDCGMPYAQKEHLCPHCRSNQPQCENCGRFTDERQITLTDNNKFICRLCK
jgi:hypothetical protein